ncbi:MAG: MmgE/PrpD family protein [Proteobacteria bacterium]|nr:MmgE/PrpD family protein [Pseudomonadota bacterium]MBU1697805.1 MmgE/PrpD family protein [Pseudomonadota bacterium]
MIDNISHMIGEHISKVRFEDLSPETVASAKRSTLDTIGAMMAGSSAPGIDMIVNLAKGWGGTEEALVAGFGIRLPAPIAAWCNGSMARALEIDDIVDFLPVHPSASTVPALLALAELKKGLSGQDYLTALAIGQDLIIRMGLTVRNNAMQTGRNNLFKIFGPTAALSKAMGFSPEEAQNALGISFSHAVGDGQCALDGALSLRLQQGIVSQGALLSVLLTAQGFTGAKNFLMGKWGYLKSWEPDPKLEFLTSGLGKEFYGEKISIKPFSSCRATHPSIDLITTLSKQHNIDAASIRKIIVRTSPEIHNLVGSPHELKANPDSVPTAQFSIQYTVAAALIRGDMFLKELDPSLFKDEEIRNLASRIHVEPDQELRSDSVLGHTEVMIQCENDVTVQGKIEFPIGSPERPMSYRDCAEKFMKCVPYTFNPVDSGHAEELIDRIETLEEIHDVSELLNYLL